MPPLDHIDSWIFDLDNTLYAPSAKLFDLIDERMGAFIMRLLNVDAAHARRVQKQYFHDHGTTMAGLMRHHGVHPEDFFLDVHNISLDRQIGRASCRERVCQYVWFSVGAVA